MTGLQGFDFRKFGDAPSYQVCQEWPITNLVGTSTDKGLPEGREAIYGGQIESVDDGTCSMEPVERAMEEQVAGAKGLADGGPDVDVRSTGIDGAGPSLDAPEVRRGMKQRSMAAHDKMARAELKLTDDQPALEVNGKSTSAINPIVEALVRTSGDSGAEGKMTIPHRHGGRPQGASVQANAVDDALSDAVEGLPQLQDTGVQLQKLVLSADWEQPVFIHFPALNIPCSANSGGAGLEHPSLQADDGILPFTQTTHKDGPGLPAEDSNIVCNIRAGCCILLGPSELHERTGKYIRAGQPWQLIPDQGDFTPLSLGHARTRMKDTAFYMPSHAAHSTQQRCFSCGKRDHNATYCDQRMRVFCSNHKHRAINAPPNSGGSNGSGGCRSSAADYSY